MKVHIQHETYQKLLTVTVMPQIKLPYFDCCQSVRSTSFIDHW